VDEALLAEQFESHRTRLKAIAYRMLGSTGDADDAVQEAWLRLTRADADSVDNLGGWLTTVVSRVCLDALRTRKSRREESLDDATPPAVAGSSRPDNDLALADSVGIALLVVLNKLAPAERVAFVLHDLFDLPFDTIAGVIGRSSDATRQLASRARRRVRGTEDDEIGNPDRTRQREIVNAFVAASRSGNLEGLLAVLDPDVVYRADATAVRLGGTAETRGAQAVAQWFKGRAQGARLALVDGAVGLLVAPGGRLLVALRMTVRDGRITAIDAVADPAAHEQLDVSLLD